MIIMARFIRTYGGRRSRCQQQKRLGRGGIEATIHFFFDASPHFLCICGGGQKKSSPLHLRRRGGTTRPKRRITNKSFFRHGAAAGVETKLLSPGREGGGGFLDVHVEETLPHPKRGKKFSAMDYACVALQLRQGRKPCSIHKMEVPTPLFADGRKEDEINIAAVCSSTPLCLMKGNAKSRSDEP